MLRTRDFGAKECLYGFRLMRVQEFEIEGSWAARSCKDLNLIERLPGCRYRRFRV